MKIEICRSNVGVSPKMKKVPIARNPLFYWCGGYRIRTDHLLHAMQAL